MKTNTCKKAKTKAFKCKTNKCKTKKIDYKILMLVAILIVALVVTGCKLFGTSVKSSTGKSISYSKKLECATDSSYSETRSQKYVFYFDKNDTLVFITVSRTQQAEDADDVKDIKEQFQENCETNDYKDKTGVKCSVSTKDKSVTESVDFSYTELDSDMKDKVASSFSKDKNLSYENIKSTVETSKYYTCK